MSKIKYGALIVLFFGAMLVLQGCGISNTVSNITYKNEKGTVSTDNKLPESWPKDAPVYPNCKAINSYESFGKEVLINLTCTDSSDKVFEYYENELKNQGWEITVSSKENYGNNLSAKKDTRTFNVVIMKAPDSASQITSVITFK